jgi:lysozyme
MNPAKACLLAVPLVFDVEGCELRAYLDKLASRPTWTIGHGTTRIRGLPVQPGQTCTRAEADAWAAEDLRSAASQVLAVVTVHLNDRQLAALTSLVYNIGIGTFMRSSVLLWLNNGHYAEAAAGFLLYDCAGGVPLEGLLTRRKRERALFLSAPDEVLPLIKSTVKPSVQPARKNSLQTQDDSDETDRLNQRELDRLTRKRIGEFE